MHPIYNAIRMKPQKLDMGHVYVITNLANNKRYIGQTWYDLNERWKKHCSKNKRGCPYLYKAIIKHGRENFTIESLARFTDPELADIIETFYIDFYCSTDPQHGYNLQGGGQNKRPPMSQEIRNKISNSRKGMVFSQEHIANLSRSQKIKAKNLSEEGQKKLDASRSKKRKLTMEQANQLREDRKSGMLLKDLAIKYQIGLPTARLITLNKTYINDYQE